MSFNALAALRGIDELIDARRVRGFEDLEEYGGCPPDEIGSSALLVLYVLAEYAGADGCAFPAQKTLAKRCRLNERTVRGILLALERWGFIERKGRVRANGTWTSDRIALTYYEPEQAAEPAGVRPAGSRRGKPAGQPCESNQRVSGPQDQRRISAAPAGVRPDPTSFEPVTHPVTSGAREADAEAADMPRDAANDVRTPDDAAAAEAPQGSAGRAPGTGSAAQFFGDLAAEPQFGPDGARSVLHEAEHNPPGVLKVRSGWARDRLTRDARHLVERWGVAVEVRR